MLETAHDESATERVTGANAIHDFDFVFAQDVYENLSLSFGIDNILNYPRRFTQGREKAVTYLAWPGTTFTLGLSYRM